MNAAVERMRAAHNQAFGPTKRWSYGPAYRKGICATSSEKTAGWNGGSWTGCGSNTFPAGDFPACHSPLDVYDLNGNAAEHMNLPLNESQMSSRGSHELGVTEMKGSCLFSTPIAHMRTGAAGVRPSGTARGCWTSTVTPITTWIPLREDDHEGGITQTLRDCAQQAIGFAEIKARTRGVKRADSRCKHRFHQKEKT